MRGLVLVGLVGCSYAFVSAPTPGVPQAECTESYAAPVIDGVLATGFGIAAVAAFAITPTNTCNPNDHNQDFCSSATLGPLAGALLLVPTAIFVISAHHGGSTVGECREQHSQTSTLTAAPTPAPRKPWNPDEK
jgi:hypothetical protein